jgi:hypothetical protein
MAEVEEGEIEEVHN